MGSLPPRRWKLPVLKTSSSSTTSLAPAYKRSSQLSCLRVPVVRPGYRASAHDRHARRMFERRLPRGDGPIIRRAAISSLRVAFHALRGRDDFFKMLAYQNYSRNFTQPFTGEAATIITARSAGWALGAAPAHERFEKISAAYFAMLYSDLTLVPLPSLSR